MHHLAPVDDAGQSHGLSYDHDRQMSWYKKRGGLPCSNSAQPTHDVIEGGLWCRDRGNLCGRAITLFYCRAMHESARYLR
ncbi:hypothetical protein CPC08DRAFT_716303 [Agrocybe pediades]|nr:hypothetical protein CPC08DRAFT_716303 [Agrocybe pediades]